MEQIKTNQMTVPVGSAPNPDPTVRTMELVDKGLASLRTELSIRFDAVTTRFEGMDEAIKIVKDDAVRVPTMLQTAILNLRELLVSADNTLEARLRGIIEARIEGADQRFIGITAQFTERDIRTSERARDTKVAVDAAFSAAKEATAKIEAGFTKQIDQLAQVMAATNAGLAGKTDDLKERISRVETQLSTVSTGKDKSLAYIGAIISAIVGFVVVAGGVVTMISYLVSRH